MIKIKNNLMRIIIWGVVAILLAGSFFLPDIVAGITDSGTLDRLAMIESQSISFDTAPVLGLSDRIELVASPRVEIIPMSSGNLMDKDAAGDSAIRELARLFRGGPFDFDFFTCNIEDAAAVFIIDTGNPNVNMYVWEVALNDAYGNRADITIDDETGMILMLIYRYGQGSANAPDDKSETPPRMSDGELRETAQELAGLMTAYYDLPVILADYDYSSNFSYYRADLADGGRLIPMYGVVKVTGFTMHERP